MVYIFQEFHARMYLFHFLTHADSLQARLPHQPYSSVQVAWLDCRVLFFSAECSVGFCRICSDVPIFARIVSSIWHFLNRDKGIIMFSWKVIFWTNRKVHSKQLVSTMVEIHLAARLSSFFYRYYNFWRLRILRCYDSCAASCTVVVLI